MTRGLIAGADIGATQARFRVVDAGGDGMARTCATGDYEDAIALVAAGLGDASVQVLCVAVAGPVTDGRARLTRGSLEFDQEAIARALGIGRVVLVNDLVALGTEVPHLGDGSLRVLGGGTLGAGTRAVIAQGTGLGMALVTADGSVLPSEGGHAPFAPADPLEQELLGVLAAQLRYVSWEDVLSGPGIADLYRAVCAVWGAAP